MGNFAAKLELPRFIPKEEILGKHVLDSEVVYVGLVEDWTYSHDGIIKMVIKTKKETKTALTLLVPFSHIDRVGQFILLKTKMERFVEHLPQPIGRHQMERTDEKEKTKKQDELKHFDELDKQKLDKLIKKKRF